MKCNEISPKVKLFQPKLKVPVTGGEAAVSDTIELIAFNLIYYI